MNNRSIPQEFITNLLSQLDIIDLIGSRLSLKKKGKNYYAICPFHHEKTPSFTVNREKQFFYCFGCNVHGNIIDFLMKYDNKNFVSCIEELSSLCNVTVPYKKNILNKKNSFSFLYRLMSLINYIYKKTLLKKKYRFALNYLKYRGINFETINKFSIGFNTPNLINLIFKICISKNIDLNYLKNSLKDIGITLNQNNFYINNIFNNRIIFPIRDQYGRIIAFGGRIINKYKIPKYVNSPDTKIFSKSNNLYGLYEIIKKNKKPLKILIVEGYIDVLSLSQIGIDYVVSSLGTSTTKQHIKTLFYYTNHIICCYDGDYAGMKASWNTLKISLSQMYDGRQLSFIFLPNGEDPDTIIKKEGKFIFEKRINNAISFVNFLICFAKSKVDISTYNGMVQLSKMLSPLINKIPGKIINLHIRQELSKHLGIISEYQLEEFLSIKNNHKNCFFYLKRTNMRLLIGLLIQNTKLVNIVKPILVFLKKIKIEGMKLFIKIVNICIKYPNINTGQLISLYKNTKYNNYIEKLAFWDHMIVDEVLEDVFKDTLLSVYHSILKRRQEELIQLDKIRSLNLKEKKEFWLINLSLFNNKSD